MADTLTTGTVGAPAGTGTTNVDGYCVTPPHGMPSYNRIVLDSLFGEGSITESEYNRTKAGLLSINDLSISASQLARLRCNGTGTEANYDNHFDDIDQKPSLSSINADADVAFVSGTKPTDKSHRLLVETTAALAAGATICRVNFALEYEDEGGVVAPNVFVACQTDVTAILGVENVTSQHYDLVTNNGIGNGASLEVAVLVQPVRR